MSQVITLRDPADGRKFRATKMVASKASFKSWSERQFQINQH